MKRLLVITSVTGEAQALGAIDGAAVIVSGIGRTNAAAATTEALLTHGPFDGVICAGIAGALPESELDIGEVIVASSCIYVEEGLLTPAGFVTMKAMGFALGDFEGNAVPVSEAMLEAAGGLRIGPIATVATCSGTDAAAREVVRRTGALAEAMEGAAVVHAARRLHVPAIEVRAISNTTGDRASQQWDIDAALAGLTRTLPGFVERLHALPSLRSGRG
jgi:futalosine hydrolase